MPTKKVAGKKQTKAKSAANKKKSRDLTSTDSKQKKFPIIGLGASALGWKR